MKKMKMLFCRAVVCLLLLSLSVVSGAQFRNEMAEAESSNTVPVAGSRNAATYENTSEHLLEEKAVGDYLVKLAGNNVFYKPLYVKTPMCNFYLPLAFTNNSEDDLPERKVRVVLYDRLGHSLYEKDNILSALKVGENSSISVGGQNLKGDYFIEPELIKQLYDYRIFFYEEEGGEYVPAGPEPATSEDEDAVKKNLVYYNGRFMLAEVCQWEDWKCYDGGIIWYQYDHFFLDTGYKNINFKVGTKVRWTIQFYDYADEYMGEVVYDLTIAVEQGKAEQIYIDVPEELFWARGERCTYEVLSEGGEGDSSVTGPAVSEEVSEPSPVTGSAVSGEVSEPSPVTGPAVSEEVSEPSPVTGLAVSEEVSEPSPVTGPAVSEEVSEPSPVTGSAVSGEVLEPSQVTGLAVSGEKSTPSLVTDSAVFRAMESRENILTGDSSGTEIVQTKKKKAGKIKKLVKSSNGNVTIFWKKDLEAVSYIIYRRQFNGKYQKIATVKGKRTYYEDTSTGYGVTYYYKIKPVYSDTSMFCGAASKDRKIVILPLQTPVITLKKGKKSGKKYVQVYFQSYHGAYAEIYVKKKTTRKKYVKLRIGKKSVASYQRRYRFVYQKSGLRLLFKVRTYRVVKGKKQYSDFSKVKGIWV